MHAGDFEPEILQDFLSESLDLHERLGEDLAGLGPRTADSELLNRIFRGLHTIKGNASFLGLTHLVEITHAAESALDAARCGRVCVDTAEIALIGSGLQVLGIQLAEIRTGRAELTRADPHLIESLTALGRSNVVGDDPAHELQGTREWPAEQRTVDTPQSPPGQTVRVEVSRIDELERITRALTAETVRDATRVPPTDLSEGLGRIARELRLAVVRTRLQPIEQLFQRYTRVISDLATRTGKRIRLQIDGGTTEVDRLAIEDLGGPLIHLLRNCADHGIETPEERLAAGKSPEGTVRLTAGYEGSNIRVRIIDDGRGLDRDLIGRKAIERGQCTPTELPGLSDEEVFRFIFGAGFSTVDRVSELSGRGVGMDVVRTNIERNLNGSIAIESVRNRGTILTITFPFDQAIIPSLIVGTGSRSVAIPLADVRETVQAEAGTIVTSGGPVFRTGGRAYPLFSVHELLGGVGVPADEHLVTIMERDGERLAIVAERLIGTEQVTVTRSERGATHPLSGAWAREDVGADPVLDLAAILKLSRQRSDRRAA